MDISHLDEHFELALALYRQRKGLLKEACADSRILESVEHRLRAHLFVLSHYIDNEEDEPATEHEVFVFLARRILAFNNTTKVKAWNFAIDWLEESGAKAEGAKTALILFPLYGDYASLLETAYQERQELRATIVNIWQKTDTNIATEIVRQSDLLSLTSELQIAIVEYAARREEYKIDFFKNHYMSLVNGKGEVHLHLLETSIFAGLIRGDGNAKTALLRGIEQFPDSPVQRRLLRLAALTGSSELLSVLDAYKETSSSAYYLLALHGNKRAVTMITEGLKQANQLEEAEFAWHLLTNVSLPKIARMYLAADSEDDFDDDYDDEIFELDEEFAEDDEVDTVPDVSFAIQWWSDNKETWSEEDRYLKGQSIAKGKMAKLIILTTGKLGVDLLDALSLELKMPIQDCSQSWFVIRKQVLETYSSDNDSLDLSMAESNSRANPKVARKRTPTKMGRPFARAQ